MAHPAVDKFGELIIHELRDKAIRHFDFLSGQHYKGLEELQRELASFSPEQLAIVRRCIVSSVDHGLHDFLFGLVEAHDCEAGIAIMVDGENVAELSDGLNGEQFTDRGWIAKFGAYDEAGQPRNS